MQLTLNFEEDDAEVILKALRNEATRLSITSRGGSMAVDRFDDQLEAAIRKPAQREATTKRKQRQQA